MVFLIDFSFFGILDSVCDPIYFRRIPKEICYFAFLIQPGLLIIEFYRCINIFFQRISGKIEAPNIPIGFNSIRIKITKYCLIYSFIFLSPNTIKS